MKKIPISELNSNVCFQFDENSPICMVYNSYINIGYKVLYFMDKQASKGFKFNSLKSVKYKTVENATKRYVILREDVGYSAKQLNRLKIIEQ